MRQRAIIISVRDGSVDGTSNGQTTEIHADFKQGEKCLFYKDRAPHNVRPVETRLEGEGEGGREEGRREGDVRRMLQETMAEITLNLWSKEYV